MITSAKNDRIKFVFDSISEGNPTPVDACQMGYWANNALRNRVDYLAIFNKLVVHIRCVGLPLLNTMAIFTPKDIGLRSDGSPVVIKTRIYEIVE